MKKYIIPILLIEGTWIFYNLFLPKNYEVFTIVFRLLEFFIIFFWGLYLFKHYGSNLRVLIKQGFLLAIIIGIIDFVEILFILNNAGLNLLNVELYKDEDFFPLSVILFSCTGTIILSLLAVSLAYFVGKKCKK